MNSQDPMSFRDIDRSLNHRDILNLNLTQKSTSTMWISKVIIWIIKAVGLGKNYHLTNVVSAVCNRVDQLSGKELNPSNLTDAYLLLKNLKGRVNSCLEKCEKTSVKMSYTQAAQALFQTESLVLKKLIETRHSESLQLPENLISEALEHNGLLLKKLSPSEQSNKLLVEKAVQSNPEAFQYASPQLELDREFILHLLKTNPQLVIPPRDELQSDFDFLCQAFKLSPTCLEYSDRATQKYVKFLIYEQKMIGLLSGSEADRFLFEKLLRENMKIQSIDPFIDQLDSLNPSQLSEALTLLKATNLNPFSMYNASPELLSNPQFLCLAAKLNVELPFELIPEQVFENDSFWNEFSKARESTPLSLCRGECESERIVADNLPEEFWVSCYPTKPQSYWSDVYQYGYNVGVQLHHSPKMDYHLGKNKKITLDSPSGKFTLKLSSEELLAGGITHRTYQIIGPKHKTRPFHHLSIDWPDYGVPSPDSFSQLTQLYSELVDSKVDSKPTTTPPKVHVHCRAGRGRSGTFLLSRSYSKNPQADPYALLADLRKYRKGLVETVNQFKFAINEPIEDPIEDLPIEDLIENSVEKAQLPPPSSSP